VVIEKDATAFGSTRDRNAIEIGRRLDGRAVSISPHDGGTLVAGLSGGGKSTLATAMLERFIGRAFQVCVFDPEGDYADFHSAVGTRPAETIATFCRAVATEPPPLPPQVLEPSQALYWGKGRGERPEVVTLHPPAEKSERHRRKYADGELGEDRSFYFRGPRN